MTRDEYGPPPVGIHDLIGYVSNGSRCHHRMRGSPGFVCTLSKAHGGRFHVAHGVHGIVLQIDDALLRLSEGL